MRTLEEMRTHIVHLSDLLHLIDALIHSFVFSVEVWNLEMDDNLI